MFYNSSFSVGNYLTPFEMAVEYENKAVEASQGLYQDNSSVFDNFQSANKNQVLNFLYSTMCLQEYPQFCTDVSAQHVQLTQK